jgi:hypothetical protein
MRHASRHPQQYHAVCTCIYSGFLITRLQQTCQWCTGSQRSKGGAAGILQKIPPVPVGFHIISFLNKHYSAVINHRRST